MINNNALTYIDEIKEYLAARKIKYAFGFYNNHSVMIFNKWQTELYPIPLLSFKRDYYNIDIGIDAIPSTSYLGFIELTITKDNILEFNFKKLTKIKFSIYGYENCLNDYYIDNIDTCIKNIKKSTETLFHIGIDFSNIDELFQLLQIV